MPPEYTVGACVPLHQDYRFAKIPRWSEAIPDFFTKELWTPVEDNSISLKEVPTEVLEAELKARGLLRSYEHTYRMDHFTVRHLNDPGFLDYVVRHNRRQVALAVAEDMATLEVRPGDGHIEFVHSLVVVPPEKTDAAPLSERVAHAAGRSYGNRAGL